MTMEALDLQTENDLLRSALNRKDQEVRNLNQLCSDLKWALTRPRDIQRPAFGMGKDWAILCPGQSLKQVDILGHDPGCVVAVNAAILHPYPVRYWCMQDLEALTRALELMSPQRKQELLDDPSFRLWIPTRWFGDPEQVPGFTWDFFCAVQHEEFVSDTREAYRSTMPDWCNSLEWLEFTFLVAIGQIVKRMPNSITCFGVDWSGDEYFIPEAANARTNMSEKRFNLERSIYNDIVRLCGHQKIKVQRA